MFLITLNLAQEQYQDVQTELIQHHSKFHPDLLKSVWENEAYWICFALVLWPPAKMVSESGMKW